MTKEKYPYKECKGCTWEAVFKDEDPDLGMGIPLSKKLCGALIVDCPHIITKEAEKVDIANLKELIRGTPYYDLVYVALDELEASWKKEQKWLDEIIGLKYEVKGLRERFYPDGEMIRGLRMDKVELKEENERLREALKEIKRVRYSYHSMDCIGAIFGITDKALGGKDE